MLKRAACSVLIEKCVPVIRRLAENLDRFLRQQLNSGDERNSIERRRVRLRRIHNRVQHAFYSEIPGAELPDRNRRIQQQLYG